ncbi:MAG: hypothetical protein ACFCVD_12005 [Nodosilinea sp.]
MSTLNLSNLAIDPDGDGSRVNNAKFVDGILRLTDPPDSDDYAGAAFSEAIDWMGRYLRKPPLWSIDNI